MKQRKEAEKPATPTRKKESGKSVPELTQQITHIIGKDPEKAAQIVSQWVKDSTKVTVKKAA